MSRPFFSPSARQDLLQILENISRDKPGAAVEFVERLEAECQLLATNPGVGTLRDDLLPNLRCWSVGNYVICFRQADDGIEVVRVLHGARDISALLRS